MGAHFRFGGVSSLFHRYYSPGGLAPYFTQVSHGRMRAPWQPDHFTGTAGALALPLSRNVTM
jgi:hypothetical protein